MNYVALRMLMGDKVKYLGIVVGIMFATLLITQQLSIFIGLMSRTYAVVTDMKAADIWVMDPQVRNIDDVRPMSDNELYRIRSVDGVQWAVPLFKGNIRAKLPNNNYQVCVVLGLDDESLTGGPPELLDGGTMNDLRMDEGIIVDAPNAKEKLGGIQVGDVLELNDNRARVVGLCRITQQFVSQPVIYTTYSRAKSWAPMERRQLSFVLVKAKPDEDRKQLVQRIRQQTGLAAYTSPEFKNVTLMYYLIHTGIPINFGTTVGLGFIVGIAIAGQTFYQFAHDNLRYFGTLKAMGCSTPTLIRMILLQGFTAGLLGYCIGIGGTALFKYSIGRITPESQQVMTVYWWILALGALGVAFIVIASSFLALIKVIRLEPAIVFK